MTLQIIYRPETAHDKFQRALRSQSVLYMHRIELMSDRSVIAKRHTGQSHTCKRLSIETARATVALSPLTVAHMAREEELKKISISTSMAEHTKAKNNR